MRIQRGFKFHESKEKSLATFPREKRELSVNWLFNAQQQYPFTSYHYGMTIWGTQLQCMHINNSIFEETHAEPDQWRIHFWTQLRPEGPKKYFGIPPPLSKGLDDPPPLISRSGSGTGNSSLLQLLTQEITPVEGIVLQLTIFQNCFFIRANWVMPKKKTLY